MKFINFNSWFLDSAQIYSLFVAVRLVCSMIALSCVMLQLDLVIILSGVWCLYWINIGKCFQQIKHIDFDITLLVMAVTLALSNLFCYCYFGATATGSYEEMSDGLYNCKWSELSVDLQKYFVVMIANAQRPLYYDGFGIAVLDLQTFTKLIKTVYSYYAMFKTITA